MATPPDFTSGQILTAAQMNGIGLWKMTGITASFTGGSAGTVSNGIVTIGSANTEISISNAFNADFLNYKIIVSVNSVSAANTALAFRFGGAASNYAYTSVIAAFDSLGPTNASTTGVNEGAFALAFQTEGCDAVADVFRPNLASWTTYTSQNIARNSTSNAQFRQYAGVHGTSTAYTSFSVRTLSGSFTGGTISVYGYNA
jgi:hypothetical protein